MNWLPALANWLPAVESDPLGRYALVTVGVVGGGCCVARGVQYASDHRAGVCRCWHAVTRRLSAWWLVAQYEVTELGVRLAPLVSVRLPRLRLPHDDTVGLALPIAAEPVVPAQCVPVDGADRLLADPHGRHRRGHRVPAQRTGGDR